jgi:universal stress protein E
METQSDLEAFSRKIDEITFIGEDARERAFAREKEESAPVKFNHVLVAYDGSEGAQDALAWARWVAKAHDAKLTHALVLPPTPETIGGGLIAIGDEAQGTINALLEDDEKYAQDMITKVKKETQGQGITAEGVIARGRPANEIVRLVKEHKADLIVMGPHRRRGFERALMGSVSTAVTQRTKTSVLIARNTPPSKNLLLAMDGSELSHRAAAVMLALPEATKKIRVVSVFPLPFAGFSQEARRLMREATTQLQNAVDRRFADGGQKVDYDLLFGKPAERILEVAQEQKSDLIVLGARGLSRLQGILLGSVSNQVVHRAKGSVLLVHRPDEV